MEKTLANLSNAPIFMTASSIISSLGYGTEQNLAAMKEYRSGIRHIEDPNIMDTPIVAAQIDKTILERKIEAQGLGDYHYIEQLLILALSESIALAQVPTNSPGTALIISTTKGAVDLLAERPLREEAFLGKMAARVAKHLGFQAPPLLISNACISGLSALIVGSRLIEAGRYNQVYIAGADLLSRFTVSGFHSFKSLSLERCRPYDAKRNGLNLGEAATAVLLSNDHKLMGSEQAIYLRAGAISNDANHISGPSRTGDGLYFAIRKALAQSQLEAKEISFVNAHGTATIYNDEMEAKALQLAGLDQCPLNSLKPYWGHTLGASGLIESIASAEALRSGLLLGNMGFETTGTTVPLSLCSNHRLLDMKHCLKTASGFAGCNAAIVLSLEPNSQDKAYALEATDINLDDRELTVHDSSIWLSDQLLFEDKEQADFSGFIRSAYKNLGLNDRKFYKMDELCKLAYIAVAYYFEYFPHRSIFQPEELGLIFCNRSSSLDTDLKHQEIIDQMGASEASPAVFVYTLPNVLLGELCIRHKIQGENTFFVGEEISIVQLKEYAQLAMAKQGLKACLIGYCDLFAGGYEARLQWIERKETKMNEIVNTH